MDVLKKGQRSVSPNSGNFPGLLLGYRHSLYAVVGQARGLGGGNAHVAELDDINPREVLALGAFEIGVLMLGMAEAADGFDGAFHRATGDADCGE